MNTTPALHRTAFVFNGSFDKSIDSFTDYVTKFIEINRGNNRPLLIRISSSGGVPEVVFAFCGLLRQVQVEGHEVWVHVLSQLCNFTYMIAEVADKVYMEPSASFQFGQMTARVSGNIIKIADKKKHQQQLFDQLCDSIVKRSKGKLKKEEVSAWRAKHISAQEALALGLCDEVAPDPEPQEKPTNKSEWVMRVSGSFANQADIYNLQIALNIFLEDSANTGRPIRVYLTSQGGTVAYALALYGLLLEAQRLGHHVTVHVIGQAYSCALWFATCALKAGTVLIDSYAMLMFHAPWIDEIAADLDDIDDLVAVQLAVYKQTRALLKQIPGFTEALISEWEVGEDRFMNAAEAVSLGLGRLSTDKPVAA
ncbi:MAG: ATP-dependent Clp protease proteolytic subunit [Cyanobacteria bacterium REEB67]|nr:ATP-dependent Clp protease proteolytic subunit [Cyanobacteria bacterium REEB67]